MILLGVAAEAEEMVFVHLTINGRYIVDLYEEGWRIERTLPMDKERLFRKFGNSFDLSNICLDLTLN